jgi:hypothetical protein
MFRHTWPALLAVAWIACSGVAVADDASALNLPVALTPETLSKSSAKGAAASASASADADVEEDALHASASATASIDSPITISGPVTTGNVGSLDGTASQISTGIGNIQQGVSATAISF